MDNLAAKTKAQFSYNRKQVEYLCGITSQEYLNFQTETGKSWLEAYWCRAIDIEALVSCTAFWNWWCYHWNSIDNRSIVMDMYKVKAGSRYSWYRQMHQYVFDENSSHREFLMKDFRDMLPVFDAALKQPLTHES